MKTFAILSIGRELLLGHTIDTNAAYLATEGLARGWRAGEIRTADDDQNAIVSALKELAAKYETVIITGGLGPTPDDLTRQAIAQFAGVELIFHQDLWAMVEARFRSFCRTPTESNKIQAYLPNGAVAIKNFFGTAPGIDLTVNGSRLFAMPGVPGEMFAMFAQHIAPILASTGSPIFMKRLKICGIGESVIGEFIRELNAELPTAEIGTAVDNMVVTVRAMSGNLTDIEAAEKKLRARFSANIFAEDDENLPTIISRILRDRKKTLALAESCTGGLIACSLIAESGASEFLREGVIVYHNDAKRRLGVSDEILTKHGAVSEECVKQLATAERVAAQVDYAIAVSGISGPTGGTPEKPVGLTWIAVADANGVAAEEFHFNGGRQENRERAKNAALFMLYRMLAGKL